MPAVDCRVDERRVLGEIVVDEDDDDEVRVERTRVVLVLGEHGGGARGEVADVERAAADVGEAGAGGIGPGVDHGAGGVEAAHGGLRIEEVDGARVVVDGDGRPAGVLAE